VLYLFDAWNLFHAGDYRNPEQLVDLLAGFVAREGARGVAVFDGAGDDRTIGALEIRYAPNADEVLERLAAEGRDREEVVVVSSDRVIRETAGLEVRKWNSREFAAELGSAPAGTQEGRKTTRVEDTLDADTRSRLERWRRKRA
jgi:predicted RNA-binding protein with PIN domain